jgi:hypothetical protein
MQLQHAPSLLHSIIRILSASLLLTTTLTSCHDTISPSPSNASSARLTIVSEHGVLGSHTTGTTIHAIGTHIPYLFHADSGYANTLLLLDDTTYVDTIGTLIMDRDHTLVISADKVTPIPPTDEPIAHALRTLLTTPTPAAFQSLLTTLDTLADTTNLDTRLRDAIHATIDPIQDSSALKALDSALANRAFIVTKGAAPHPQNSGSHDNDNDTGGGIVSNILPPSPPSPRLSLSPLSRSLDEEPVVITHINGILTSPFDALQNATYIARIIQEIAWPAAIPYTVTLLYNPTAGIPPDQRTSLHRCLSHLADRADKLGVNSFPLFLAKCTGKTIKDAIAHFDDIREAAWQYFKLITNIKAPEPHAIAIADSTTRWRNQGNHVLYVPHSQGNMMVQEAVNLLATRSLYNPPRDSTCLGVVSLAAPLSSHWPVSSKHLKGLAVEGDLILSLKTNDFPRSRTPLSDSATRDIKKWSEINPLIAAYKRVIWGLRLHSLIEGYLHPSALRSQFESAIVHTYGSCALNYIAPSPSVLKLLATHSGQFSATLYDFNNNPLDGHRTIFWSLEDGLPNTSAATVSSSGVAHAHYVGSVGARVYSKTRSTATAIEVDPIPLQIAVDESAFTEYYSGAGISLGVSPWNGGSRCDGQIITEIDEKRILIFGQICTYHYEISVPDVPTADKYEFLLFEVGSTSNYRRSIRPTPSASIDQIGASPIVGGTGEAPKPIDRIHVIALDKRGFTLGIGATCLRGCQGWPNKLDP